MKIDTIIRTIVLALALINQLFAIMGWHVIDISDDMVAQLVTSGATIVAAVWAWWKNNSFTRHAIAGDEHKEAVKSGQ